MIYYDCVRTVFKTNEEGKEIATKETWEAKAEVTFVRPGIIDAIFEGRLTRLAVIIGVSRYGNFIAIPELYVSSPLAEWKDLFWNTERLSAHMNKIDAITVTTGIKVLMEKLIKDRIFTWDRNYFV
jgi:hypothetical protein